ncbi:MAG: leucyl aminopeptidase family protein [Crocinitomicaceae bacterium]|nr:leucyl aminopeptidase family protein [Crocinitomicaceae bacterium]
MFVFPKYSGKTQSVNSVYLISESDKIQISGLSAEKISHLKSLFKEGNFALFNEFGKVAVFCKFEDLKKDGNKEKLRDLGHKVYEATKGLCESFHITGGTTQAQELFIEGFALSSYEFSKYFTKPKKQKLTGVTYDNKSVNIDKIQHIIDVTLWARDLVNEPVSYLNAEQLANEIVKKCKGTSVKSEVLGQAKIEALKMGGLLAVNKGSVDSAAFTILEYKPKKFKNKKPIVLVGKGIVYDTGGLSLKPTKGSMDSMKCDMAGAAAMAATIIGAAKIGLPLHLVALLPATDNRPGGNAYTPGDVITMFDGTTIEVLNTDAEGRMILADALSYAKKYKPELVIDAATLTGAAAAAIGPHASVAMGNASQKEFDSLNKAGFATHDRIVQFPFWDEYKDEMKSTIADMKNIGGSFAGMITAGKFLEHFTDYPYIHLDIAGPAFNNAKDSYRGLGGTGCGVRLLIEYLSSK